MTRLRLLTLPIKISLRIVALELRIARDVAGAALDITRDLAGGSPLDRAAAATEAPPVPRPAAPDPAPPPPPPPRSRPGGRGGGRPSSARAPTASRPPRRLRPTSRPRPTRRRARVPAARRARRPPPSRPARARPARPAARRPRSARPSARPRPRRPPRPSARRPAQARRSTSRRPGRTTTRWRSTRCSPGSRAPTRRPLPPCASTRACTRTGRRSCWRPRRRRAAPAARWRPAAARSGAPDRDVARGRASAHLDGRRRRLGCRGGVEAVLDAAGERPHVEPRGRALADADVEVAGVRLEDDGPAHDLAEAHVAGRRLRADVRLGAGDRDAAARDRDAQVAGDPADPDVARRVLHHAAVVQLAQADVAGAAGDLGVTGREVDLHVACAGLQLDRAGVADAHVAHAGAQAAVAEAALAGERPHADRALDVRAGGQLDRHVDRAASRPSAPRAAARALDGQAGGGRPHPRLPAPPAPL